MILPLSKYALQLCLLELGLVPRRKRVQVNLAVPSFRYENETVSSAQHIM